jgi:MFS family permease
MLAPPSPPTKRTEFARGWPVILAAFAGAMFGISAIPFYTLGLFVKPVGEAFGWSRETVQWGFTAQMLGMLCVSWLWGAWMDRAGARRVAIVAQVGFGVGLMGLALVQSFPGWLAAWFLVALLGAGTSPVTWTRGLAGWFDAARGTAFGLALAGTGAMAFLAPPMLAPFIETHGWRAAYVALGVSVLVVALPLSLLLFRDSPSAAAGHVPPPATGLTRAQILRSPRFWLMFLVFFAITFAVGGIIPSIIPLLTDRGMERADAASYAAIVGIAVVAGRIVAGLALDRFDARHVALAFLTLPALSCLLLASDALPGGAALGLAVALVGLAAGAEFDLAAFMVSRWFGMKAFGVAYAILTVGMLVGGGFAPPIFGRIFDQTGSYDAALAIAGGIFLAAPLLMLGMGRSPPELKPAHA